MNRIEILPNYKNKNKANGIGRMATPKELGEYFEKRFAKFVKQPMNKDK